MTDISQQSDVDRTLTLLQFIDLYSPQGQQHAQIPTDSKRQLGKDPRRNETAVQEDKQLIKTNLNHVNRKLLIYETI